MKAYDYVIVGSGFFGSVFAQQAVEAGKSVLVLEKRNHIGGNCYSHDYEDTGINIHSYGTHIFHTSDPKLWAYINRFTEFNRYQHRVLTTYKGKVFSMPINLGTINAFYNVNLKPGEAEAFLASKRESIPDPRNLEEKAISLIGRELYDAFIKGYTMKQWGCDPRAHRPASSPACRFARRSTIPTSTTPTRASRWAVTRRSSSGCSRISRSSSRSTSSRTASTG